MDEELLDEAVCPACGEPVEPDDAFCQACGAALNEEEEAEAPDGEPREGARRPAGQRRKRTSGARRDAARELRRVRKVVTLVRFLAGLNVLGGLLLTVAGVAVLALPEVPAAGGMLLAVLGAVFTGLYLLAWFQAPFQPFLWMSILAGGATLDAVASLGAQPLFFVPKAIWALLMWLAVLPTIRARRLMRQHPDLALQLGLGGKGVRLDYSRGRRERVTSAATRLDEARRRSLRLASLLGGSVLVLAAGGAGWILAAVRPSPIEDTLAAFRTAWEEGDWEALARLRGNWVGDPFLQRLREGVERRGWSGRMPPLAEEQPEALQTGRRWTATFLLLDDSPVTTVWTTRGTRWRLVDLVLPPPPFDPVAEATVAAWEQCTAEDTSALAALWSLDRQARMERKLAAVARGRSWDRFPAVVETEGSVESDTAELRLVLEGEQEATLRFVLEDDRWVARTLRPPARD